MSPVPVEDRYRLVPAAYVYLLRGSGPDLEVLLQQRGTTGYRDGHWAAAAAGHVERGESARAAAVREAREEIGVVLDEADLVALTVLQRTEPGNDDPVEQRVDFFLTARRWEGEPTVLEPVKCAGLRWCRLDALPSPLVPHEATVLAQLATGEVPPFSAWGYAG